MAARVRGADGEEQWILAEVASYTSNTQKYPSSTLYINSRGEVKINTCSVKQPDLCYFETIKMTSQA